MPSSNARAASIAGSHAAVNADSCPQPREGVKGIARDEKGNGPFSGTFSSRRLPAPLKGEGPLDINLRRSGRNEQIYEYTP